MALLSVLSGTAARLLVGLTLLVRAPSVSGGATSPGPLSWLVCNAGQAATRQPRLERGDAVKYVPSTVCTATRSPGSQVDSFEHVLCQLSPSGLAPDLSAQFFWYQRI